MGTQLLVVCGALAWLVACGSDGPKPEDSCTPGSLGCACGQAGACGEGLSCENGLCQAAMKRLVTIDEPRARACELLFTELGGAHLLGAKFDDSVQGTFAAERPLVALAITTRADRPITASAVALVQARAAGSVVLKKSTCFDSRGTVLPRAVVTLADVK